MPPTDTDLAASNLSLGTFTPTQLYSGEKAPVTTSFVVEDTAVLAKYEVVALNASGEVCAWDPMSYSAVGDAFATGTLTFSGTGTAGDTVTLNGNVITMRNGDAADNYQDEFNIGGDAAGSGQAFKALVNAYPDLYGVTASGAGAAIVLTRRVPGTVGNAYTTTESGTGASFGAATLTGGTDIAGEPGPKAKAIGIAMQACDNTDDGKSVPVLIEGVLNPAALVWPDVSENFDGTTAAKIKAFAGTGIVIRTLK